MLTEDDVMSLGADGWIMDDEMAEQHGDLIEEVTRLAVQSESDELQDAAQDYLDYVEAGIYPETARHDIHNAVRDIAEACKVVGYIDEDWVVLEFPSLSALEAYVSELFFSDQDESLSGREEEWGLMGLDMCQRIVDEQNTSESMPEYIWLSGEMLDFEQEYNLVSGDGLAITTAAVEELCPTYQSILD